MVLSWCAPFKSCFHWRFYCEVVALLFFYFMRALPRKHGDCAVPFPRLPFSSWQVLLYSGIMCVRALLTNIGFCAVLFSWPPLICKLFYNQHCSCIPALPHKHRVCAVLFSQLPLICTLCYIHHCSRMRACLTKWSEFSVPRTLSCHITSRIHDHVGLLWDVNLST